jgi:gliding motility-associated-like protein
MQRFLLTLPCMKLKLLLLFLCALFYSWKSWSQGLCNNGGGGFQISTDAGCAPLAVNVTNTVVDPFLVGYNFNYDGASLNPPTQDISTFRYDTPGVFTILQQGASSAGKFYACRKVSVLEARPIYAIFLSCGGGKVTITLSNDVVTNAYDQVQIEFGDGSSHTWRKGDAYTIDHNYTDTSRNPQVRFQGIYDGGKACDKGAFSFLNVTFQQPQLNEIEIKSLEMRGNGSLELNYFGLGGVSTQIQYSSNDGTSFTTSATRSGAGVQVTRINDLNTSQVYKVKLGSADLCGGARDSRVITSMVVTGKTENEANLISWNQYPADTGFVSYELLRDGISIATFTDVEETLYTDENVQCGDNFEYQLVAKTTTVTSISAPVSVKTTVDKAKTIENASVTVLGESAVSIQAVVPGAASKGNYELIIEKAEAGSSTFKRLVTLYNEDQYDDLDVNAMDKSYCYRISYQNACGQRSPATEPFCTILLNMQLPLLKWTVLSPFLDELEGYTLLQSSKTGVIENQVQLNTEFLPKFSVDSDLQYEYQVRADSKDGNFQSLSNVLIINRNINVFVPDAFSPNGDGENEIFEAKAELFKHFQMDVYSRWGQNIYHSDDITKGWDGTIDGVKAPVGSYVYKLTLVDIIDQTVEKKGTFMLFR